MDVFAKLIEKYIVKIKCVQNASAGVFSEEAVIGINTVKREVYGDFLA